MKQCLIFIAIINLAMVPFSAGCRAQERQAVNPSEPGREEWQARVKTSREHVDLMRRQHRSFVPQQPGPDEMAEAASRQVLEDDSLLPGDIVSTNHGLFRFQGSPNRERKPEDFVRIR